MHLRALESHKLTSRLSRDVRQSPGHDSTHDASRQEVRNQACHRELQTLCIYSRALWFHESSSRRSGDDKILVEHLTILDEST